MRLRAAVAALLMVVSLPVPPPGPHEPPSYDHEWVRFRVLCVRVGMCERQRGYFESIPPPTTTTTTTTTSPPPAPAVSSSVDTGMGSSVEQWRDLVSSYFGSTTDAALSVMACESGGNPNAVNPSSGAAGLFQFMPFWWEGSWDPFDPVQNVSHAADLSAGGTDWSHWSCQP